MIGEGRREFNGSPCFRLLDLRACVLRCLRYDLLQGLILPLNFLRIGQTCASTLVSKAAIVVCVRVIEQQSGALVLWAQTTSACYLFFRRANSQHRTARGLYPDLDRRSMRPSSRLEMKRVERRSLYCWRNSSENTHPAVTVNHSLALQDEG